MKLSKLLKSLGIFAATVAAKNFTICNEFSPESNFNVSVWGENMHYPFSGINLAQGQCGSVNADGCNQIGPSAFSCEIYANVNLMRSYLIGIINEDSDGNIKADNIHPWNGCIEEIAENDFTVNEVPANNSVCPPTFRR